MKRETIAHVPLSLGTESSFGYRVPVWTADDRVDLLQVGFVAQVNEASPAPGAGNP